MMYLVLHRDISKKCAQWQKEKKRKTESNYWPSVLWPNNEQVICYPCVFLYTSVFILPEDDVLHLMRAYTDKQNTILQDCRVKIFAANGTLLDAYYCKPCLGELPVSNCKLHHALPECYYMLQEYEF